MRRLLARFFLYLGGWKQRGEVPPLDKIVAVSAPHTSNWDFFVLLAFGWLRGIKYCWMGKKSLFWGPLGWILRRMGGIAVDRSSRNSLVEQVAQAFRARQRLVLAIPPEGTRGRTDYWKSGFYHIARAAGVPLVLGTLDYANRIGEIGPTIWPTDDVRGDMDRIRAYYADKRHAGKYPDQFGPVRLREEDDSDARDPP